MKKGGEGLVEKGKKRPPGDWKGKKNLEKRFGTDMRALYDIFSLDDGNEK